MLDVRAGESGRFEQAFQQAEPLIAVGRRLPASRAAPLRGEPDRFLLLVWWASLEDHTLGFRGSPAYQEWKALLHHFYDPFPVVEHFTVDAARPDEVSR